MKQIIDISSQDEACIKALGESFDRLAKKANDVVGAYRSLLRDYNLLRGRYDSLLRETTRSTSVVSSEGERGK